MQRVRRESFIYLKSYTSQMWYIILLLISVYSPFSDRVGLPLNNIISPFIPVMDIFSVDLKFCYIRLYTV